MPLHPNPSQMNCNPVPTTLMTHTARTCAKQRQPHHPTKLKQTKRTTHTMNALLAWPMHQHSTQARTTPNDPPHPPRPIVVKLHSFHQQRRSVTLMDECVVRRHTARRQPQMLGMAAPTCQETTTLEECQPTLGRHSTRALEIATPSHKGSRK